MRDFSFTAYRAYLEAISASYENIYRFADFLRLADTPESFCLIRHDVDRKARNAQTMAKLEHEMGLHATYYFRAKSHTFQPDLIREVSELGHEIGYHYESLSDTNGDMEAALSDFRANLGKFRKICDIHTISMHGQPLKPIDNRDLWRKPEHNRMLKEEFGLLGEIYLEIDYSGIAYINDTGRNWTDNRQNIRDTVGSDISTALDGAESLLKALETKRFPKIVFQIHPERWEENPLRWMYQWSFDMAANGAKWLLNTVTPA